MGDMENTKITVMSTFQDRAMNWNPAIHGNPIFKFYPARIGMMFNNPTNKEMPTEYKWSGVMPKVRKL